MAEVVRFDGYVDGWPVGWAAGVAERARVQIGATDRMQRLTDLRPLRAPLVEHFSEPGTTGTPVVFGDSGFDEGDVFPSSIGFLFPLQEDPTATSAGDTSGAPSLPYLTSVDTSADARVQFGVDGVMPEGAMVTFTPAGSYRPQLVATDPDFGVDGLGDWTLFFAFALPATPAGTARLLRLAPVVYPGWPYPLLKVDVSTTGLTVTWSGYAGLSPESVTITDAHDFADGQPHFVKIWHDTSAGIPGTMHVQVDNRSAWSDAAPDLAYNRFAGLQLGNSLTADPVSLAWVGWSPTVVTDNLAAMVLGLPERSDVRVARYLTWCGFGPDDMALEPGESSVGFIPTTGVAALDAIASVMSVEQGLFFASGDTLTMHSRNHRVGSGTAMTLTPATVGPDIVIEVSTARLVNDYSVARQGGASYRAVNAESVAAYGRRTRSETIPAATDADLRSAADSLVQRYGSPEPHCPSIVCNLTTLDDETVGALMRLQLGDKIALTGLPVQAPGEALALFVEGLEDRISVAEWTLTITTTPAGLVAATTFDGTDEFALFDSTAAFIY